MATQIIDKFFLPSLNKPNKMYRFKSPDKFNSYEELNQKVQIHCLFTFLGCFSKFGYLNVWQLNHHGNDLDSGGHCTTALSPPPIFFFPSLHAILPIPLHHPYSLPFTSFSLSPLYCESERNASVCWYLSHFDSKNNTIPGNEKGKYRTESCDAHSLLTQFYFQSAH